MAVRDDSGSPEGESALVVLRAVGSDHDDDGVWTARWQAEFEGAATSGLVVGSERVVDALKLVDGPRVLGTVDRTVLRALTWPVVLRADLLRRAALETSEVAALVSGLIEFEPTLRVVVAEPQLPQE